MAPMSTPYITHEEIVQRVNSIAVDLGVEKPYVTVSYNDYAKGTGNPVAVSDVTLDRRLYRNWLEAVAQVAARNGAIQHNECIGQLSLFND